MNKEKLQIKLESSGHEVEMNALAGILRNYNNLIIAICIQVGNRRNKVNVKVNAFQKGSFIIDCLVQGVTVVAGIGTIISTAILIYQFKKGQKVNLDKLEDRTFIQNNISLENKISIINIYNNSSVRNSIGGILNHARKDDNISGIMFSDEGNLSSVQVDREHFFKPIETYKIDNSHISKEGNSLLKEEDVPSLIQWNGTNGFINHNGETYEIKSIKDLEDVYNKLLKRR